MANFRYRDYIYDWNSATKVAPLTNKKIELHDETLRDGIQSPSVVDPPVEQKIELLYLMEDLAIDSLDVGIPGAGPWQFRHSLELCKEIVKNSLHIRPTCAARTVRSDIEKVIEISQQAGIPVEIMAFIGSSPIRLYAEEWDMDDLLRATEMAVRLGVENGLPVTYVTEDTTRSRPETLDRLFRLAVEAGASAHGLAHQIHEFDLGGRGLLGPEDLAEMVDTGVGHQDAGMVGPGLPAGERGGGLVPPGEQVEYGGFADQGKADQAEFHPDPLSRCPH